MHVGGASCIQFLIHHSRVLSYAQQSAGGRWCALLGLPPQSARLADWGSVKCGMQPSTCVWWCVCNTVWICDGRYLACTQWSYGRAGVWSARLADCGSSADCNPWHVYVVGAANFLAELVAWGGPRAARVLGLWVRDCGCVATWVRGQWASGARCLGAWWGTMWVGICSGSCTAVPW